jgi:hypothetical protein
MLDLTSSEGESEVSNVKGARNIGQSEGRSHRGQRRVARGDMLPVVLISILLNLTQLGVKPIGAAARPGCESAESKSKPQTSDACDQVSGDGHRSTRNSQKFG